MYTHLHQFITIQLVKEETTNTKESGKGYMWGLEGGKGREECCNCIVIPKRKKERFWEWGTRCPVQREGWGKRKVRELLSPNYKVQNCLNFKNNKHVWIVILKSKEFCILASVRIFEALSVRSGDKISHIRPVCQPHQDSPVWPFVSAPPWVLPLGCPQVDPKQRQCGQATSHLLLFISLPETLP